MAEGHLSGNTPIGFISQPLLSKTGRLSGASPIAFFDTTQCPDNTPPPDVVAPFVEVISPVSVGGVPNITSATEIVLRTWDEGGGLVSVTVDVNYASGLSESAYDGVKFKPLYAQGSSITPITVTGFPGFEILLKRAAGGWPESPIVQVSPVDSAGNRSS